MSFLFHHISNIGSLGVNREIQKKKNLVVYYFLWFLLAVILISDGS